MLFFQEFKKSYNSHHIIDIPLLELTEGLYQLKGGNGSGKTTLIKCIAGLIPFSGGMELFGVPNTLKHQQAYRKMVSFAPSEPTYPGFMKGSDLIHLHQSIRGSSERDAKTTTALGVDQFQNQKISTYSSGMIKKLSLVLALIGATKLIVLDEPLNALDTEAVKSLPTLIQQYQQLGSSFIVTSHQEVDWHPLRFTQLKIHDAKVDMV